MAFIIIIISGTKGQSDVGCTAQEKMCEDESTKQCGMSGVCVCVCTAQRPHGFSAMLVYCYFMLGFSSRSWPPLPFTCVHGPMQASPPTVSPSGLGMPPQQPLAGNHHYPHPHPHPGCVIGGGGPPAGTGGGGPGSRLSSPSGSSGGVNVLRSSASWPSASPFTGGGGVPRTSAPSFSPPGSGTRYVGSGAFRPPGGGSGTGYVGPTPGGMINMAAVAPLAAGGSPLPPHSGMMPVTQLPQQQQQGGGGGGGYGRDGGPGQYGLGGAAHNHHAGPPGAKDTCGLLLTPRAGHPAAAAGPSRGVGGWGEGGGQESGGAHAHTGGLAGGGDAAAIAAAQILHQQWSEPLDCPGPLMVPAPGRRGRGGGGFLGPLMLPEPCVMCDRV